MELRQKSWEASQSLCLRKGGEVSSVDDLGGRHPRQWEDEVRLTQELVWCAWEEKGATSWGGVTVWGCCNEVP